MVRTDLGVSGVAFTLDTESGFRDAVFVTSSYGLGEMVVQGAVNPDEFFVYKPALAQGKRAVLRRTRGSKQKKMIYADSVDGRGGGVQTVDVDEKDRAAFSLTDDDLTELARNELTAASDRLKEAEVALTKFRNEHGAIDPRVPFGGAKQSGYGVEFARAGLLECAQPVAIKGAAGSFAPSA